MIQLTKKGTIKLINNKLYESIDSRKIGRNTYITEWKEIRK